MYSHYMLKPIRADTSPTQLPFKLSGEAVAAPGSPRGANASLKFYPPPLSVKSRKNEPTFCEVMKKWAFSCTKWPKTDEFPPPPEVVVVVVVFVHQ